MCPRSYYNPIPHCSDRIVGVVLSVCILLCHHFSVSYCQLPDNVYSHSILFIICLVYLFFSFWSLVIFYLAAAELVWNQSIA